MTSVFINGLPCGCLAVCLALSGIANAQETSPVPSRTDHKANRSPTAPAAEDLERFSGLLKISHTGIVKLLNIECPTESRLLISANAQCLNGIASGGAAFSFRDRAYSVAPASDIRLTKGQIVAGGLFTLGAIVDIGEADISQISVATPGISFLDSYVPRTKGSEVARESAAVNEHRSDGRFIFAGAAPLITGHVYGLRSVGYRSETRSLEGNRDDVLIVFLAVRVDEVGNATLVWKELWRRHAPLLDTTK
ncbi:MAG TPA: hypothetical protein VL501_00920 [Pyrinomonadaceae bacterium]|nr:hypothetical protein [Pyrinomonadaceae bacterium]